MLTIGKGRGRGSAMKDGGMSQEGVGWAAARESFGFVGRACVGRNCLTWVEGRAIAGDGVSVFCGAGG